MTDQSVSVGTIDRDTSGRVVCQVCGIAHANLRASLAVPGRSAESVAYCEGCLGIALGGIASMVKRMPGLRVTITAEG